METLDPYAAKRAAYTLFAWVGTGFGIAMLTVGGFGIVQGMSTRSVGPLFLTCFVMGAVILLVGLSLFGSAAGLPDGRSCPHCGEELVGPREICPACRQPIA